MKARLFSQPVDVLMRQHASGLLLEDAVRKHARAEPTSGGARQQEAIERLAARELLAPAAANACRTKELKDGTVGWCVRAPRGDDCFCAAIATTLQIPIDEIPDPRIDERLAAGDPAGEVDRDAREELEAWLSDHGLRIVVHSKVPVALDRWIGVVPLPGDFNSHSMCMSHNRVLWDPVAEVDARPVRIFSARDVRSGYSFRAI